MAFERAGGRCVFSAEYDRYAQRTYETFYRERPDFSHLLKVNPPGDITQLPPELVPDHDVLTAGFPCQPFSLAGVSKKKSLGRPHGFKDPTQGTLFFNLKEIINKKLPKAFLLENVKNLLSHDQKRTFRIIYNTLAEKYHVTYRVIDAAAWVPQHRERIYIVGFRKRAAAPGQGWSIPEFPELDELRPSSRPLSLEEILEKTVPEKYTLGTGTWETLKRHRAYHESIGQGFGYGLIEPPFTGKVTRTISARYHKDGAEVLIAQKDSRPRRLTPLECGRLFGFPDEHLKYFKRDGYKQPVSDTQAYRQFGNSVAVPLVAEVAKLIARRLQDSRALAE